MLKKQTEKTKIHFSFCRRPGRDHSDQIQVPFRPSDRGSHPPVRRWSVRPFYRLTVLTGGGMAVRLDTRPTPSIFFLKAWAESTVARSMAHNVAAQTLCAMVRGFWNWLTSGWSLARHGGGPPLGRPLAGMAGHCSRRGSRAHG